MSRTSAARIARDALFGTIVAPRPSSDACRGRPFPQAGSNARGLSGTDGGQWPQNNVLGKWLDFLRADAIAFRQRGRQLPFRILQRWSRPCDGLRVPGRQSSYTCAQRVERQPANTIEYVRLGELCGPKPEKGRIKVQLGTGLLRLNVLALSGLAQPVTKRALMEDRVLAPAFVLLAAACSRSLVLLKLPPPILPAFGPRMTARRRLKSRNAAAGSAARSSG